MESEQPEERAKLEEGLKFARELMLKRQGRGSNESVRIYVQRKKGVTLSLTMLEAVREELQHEGARATEKTSGGAIAEALEKKDREAAKLVFVRELLTNTEGKMSDVAITRRVREEIPGETISREKVRQLRKELQLDHVTQRRGARTKAMTRQREAEDRDIAELTQVVLETMRRKNYMSITFERTGDAEVRVKMTRVAEEETVVKVR